MAATPGCSASLMSKKSPLIAATTRCSKTISATGSRPVTEPGYSNPARTPGCCRSTVTTWTVALPCAVRTANASYRTPGTTVCATPTGRTGTAPVDRLPHKATIAAHRLNVSTRAASRRHTPGIRKRATNGSATPRHIQTQDT